MFILIPSTIAPGRVYLPWVAILIDKKKCP